MLIEERAKPANERLSWADTSKILNAKGPCIKSTDLWISVSIMLG